MAFHKTLKNLLKDWKKKHLVNTNLKTKIKYMRLISFSIILIFLSSILYAENDASNKFCNCSPVASALAAKESATHVFAAKINDIKLSEYSNKELNSNEKEFVINARVIKFWKGDFKETITIRTAHNEDSCGFLFKSNKSYLIYAVGGEHPLVTSCTRTSELDSSNASSDLKVIGKAKYPKKENKDLPDFLK